MLPFLVDIVLFSISKVDTEEYISLCNWEGPLLTWVCDRDMCIKISDPGLHINQDSYTPKSLVGENDSSEPPLSFPVICEMAIPHYETVFEYICQVNMYTQRS